MDHRQEPIDHEYPHGRGYGHDYMRGGEVFGGYGYSARAEYDLPRGELQRRTGGHVTDGFATDDPGETRSP